jgi:hypothetical protein
VRLGSLITRQGAGSKGTLALRRRAIKARANMAVPSGEVLLTEHLPRPETPQVQPLLPVRGGNVVEPPSLVATAG